MSDLATPTEALAALDKQIDANRRIAYRLAGRRRAPRTAGGWQFVWDTRPDCQETEHALYCQRYDVQQEIYRAEAKAAAKKAAAERRAFIKASRARDQSQRCQTCGQQVAA